MGRQVLTDEMGDDGVAVADQLLIIDDVRKLGVRPADEASKMCSCRNGS